MNPLDPNEPAFPQIEMTTKTVKYRLIGANKTSNESGSSSYGYDGWHRDLTMPEITRRIKRMKKIAPWADLAIQITKTSTTITTSPV